MPGQDPDPYLVQAKKAPYLLIAAAVRIFAVVAMFLSLVFSIDWLFTASYLALGAGLAAELALRWNDEDWIYRLFYIGGILVILTLGIFY